MLASKEVNHPLRAWMIGCGTGEEAYALGIALLELLGVLPHPVRIFATDVRDEHVADARRGWYPPEAVMPLSADIRARYFREQDDGYRIGPRLQASMVFARHDIAHDAPFPTLDLVSCRALAHLRARSRAEVVAKLHYALRPGGVLWLDRDDLTGGMSQLFEPIDWAAQIFERGSAASRLHVIGKQGARRVAFQSVRPASGVAPPPAPAAEAPRRPDAEPAAPSALHVELLAVNAALWSRNRQLLSEHDALRVQHQHLQSVRAKLRTQTAEVARLGADLGNVLASIGIPMLILDADRRIRRYTPEATHILKVIERDVGRRFTDLKCNLAIADLDERLSRVIDCMETQESEVQDLSGRWYKLRIRPYATPEGRVDFILSLIDIDDLKALLQRTVLAHHEAELANQTKDQFLATLSHELRSPLHGILVYAQLLQRGGCDPDRVQRASREISSSVQLLVQLIDDLLDVSRIVNGKLGLEAESIDLAAVVRRVLDGAMPTLAAKSLRLETDLPEVLPMRGDGTRLQQVVGNLVSNAVKFTPSGGAIAVSLAAEGERAVLCVRDSGVGIDAGFLPRVFDRFTQANATLARSFGGLGLGLAIVRHLVELHGGVVRAESAGVGRGATFTVEVPRAAMAERAAPCPAPVSVPTPQPGALDRTRVLIVDDDRAARHALGELLEHAGAEVWSAPSAADAMEALDDFEPEVMLCDIAMPGEDGFSLMRRVRARKDRAAAVPALALTALASPSDRERALAAGYQGHLTKPVDIDGLLVALATLVPTRGSRVSAGTDSDPPHASASSSAGSSGVASSG